MEKLKRISASTLVLIMILLSVSCGKQPKSNVSSIDSNVSENGTSQVVNQSSSDSELNSSSIISSKNGSTTNNSTAPSTGFVKPIANKTTLVLPDYDVKNKNVKMLTTVDFVNANPDHPYAKVRSLVKTKYGINFTPIITTYTEMASKAMSLIAAGSPPDILDGYRIPVWYPRMCKEGTFADIGQYINLDDKIWNDKVDLFKNYELNGKFYCFTDSFLVSEVVYNKKVLAGLEDPMSLYKKNQWTWDVFLDYIKNVSGDTDGDGRPNVYGTDFTNLAESYLTSIGTGVTSMNGNLLTLDPIKGTPYNKLGEFLAQFKGSDAMALMGGISPQDALNQDKLAFSLQGRYLVMNNSSLTSKKNIGDIGIVPVPRQADASKYYGYSYLSGSILPAKGNVIGAIAVCTAIEYNGKLSASSEELTKSYNKLISDKWDANSAHVMVYDTSFRTGSFQKITPVAIGYGFAPADIQQTFYYLLNDPLTKGKTYTSVRDGYLPRLQAAVDSANKSFN